jgi:hypothetical protein
MTAYGSAALGQLFFFHVVLIQKVIVMVALQRSSRKSFVFGEV